MTTLKICPYGGKADSKTLLFTQQSASAALLATSIAELIHACVGTTQLDEDTTVFDLLAIYNAPPFDELRDRHLWRDASGRLIGFGQLLIWESSESVEGNLWCYAHPTLGRAELETEILQWGEERLREVGKRHNLPVKLYSSTHINQTEHQRLLQKHGFTASRGFYTMARSLVEPIPEPQLPQGFTLQPLNSQGEAKAWVELFNESFIDHWGHKDLTVETLQHWLRNSQYRPELNLVAVAPSGKFAAFCYSNIKPEENIRNRRQDGWIRLLGTRRDFRRLGLGRAVLLAGMRQLQAAGMETVKLAVDGESLTGAKQLYRAVGFQPVDTWMSWVKEI